MKMKSFLPLYNKILAVESLKTYEEKMESIYEIFWYLLTHLNDILYPLPHSESSERIKLIKIIYTKSKELQSKTPKLEEVCNQLIYRIDCFSKELPYSI